MAAMLERVRSGKGFQRVTTRLQGSATARAREAHRHGAVTARGNGCLPGTVGGVSPATPAAAAPEGGPR